MQDVAFVNAYYAAAEAARRGEAAGLEAFLDTYCHGVARHVDYLEAVGMERLLGLGEY